MGDVFGEDNIMVPSQPSPFRPTVASSLREAHMEPFACGRLKKGCVFGLQNNVLPFRSYSSHGMVASLPPDTMTEQFVYGGLKMEGVFGKESILGIFLVLYACLPAPLSSERVGSAILVLSTLISLPMVSSSPRGTLKPFACGEFEMESVFG